MKFLVLGCNGMAGHMISLYLKEQGHIVTGFARKDSQLVNTIIGNARNLEFIRDIIVQGKFDFVINCIGVLNKSAECNHEAAVLLNSYLPQYLADITKNTATQVIHMSTDCVFSGNRGGYTEYDLPDGTSFYDRSKALGELDDCKNVTLRNSIVGPDINPNGIGLLNWFLQQKKSVYGYTQVFWTGLTTLQLAKVMEQVALQHVHGLYHMVPEKCISKYDMLVLFNDKIRRTSIKIIPENDIKIDKSLIRTNFNTFNYTIPDFETQIRELADWMKKHQALYPHYEL